MPHSKRNGKYWVDKKEFYDAVVIHRKHLLDARKEDPDALYKLTPYLAQVVTNIAHGVMSRYNFNRYSYRDEMISDAILTIMKYFNTFDPKKSDNPYGYFWLAAYRSGQRRVILETEQTAIRAKSVQNMIMDDANLESGELDDFKTYMTDFFSFDVHGYEEKKKGKKDVQKGHYRVTTKKERDAEAQDKL